MADTSQGEGWWQASNQKWYPPEKASEGPPRQSAKPVQSDAGNLSGGQLVGLLAAGWGVVATLMVATDDVFDAIDSNAGRIDVLGLPILTLLLGLYWMTRK